LTLFRKDFAIRVWRRRTFQSWVKFATSCVSPSFARNASVHREHFDIKKGASLPIRRGRAMEPIVQPFDWIYSWTTAGFEGYKRWYNHQNIRNPILKDSMGPAADCIQRVAESSWWEWLAGSTLLFWRWPRSHLEWARDGQPHFQTGELPKFTIPQAKPKTSVEGKKMKEKLDKVRQRRYIESDHVESLTHMFAVLKGLDDIRMVYNGTSSGLNDVLWAAHFGLPIVQYTLRSLLPGYHQCDMDVGEMFLNFPLHKDIRPYAGVDITHMRGNGTKEQDWEVGRMTKWERWARNFMGLTDSPYRSLQLLIKAKHVAYDNHKGEVNPFK